VTESPAEPTVVEFIEKLARTAAQIRDPVLRRYFIVLRLLDQADPLVVEFLHEVQNRALRGDLAAQSVVAAGLDAQLLADEFGHDRVGRLFHEANRKKYSEVCNLFRTLRPAKTPDGDEDAFYRYGLVNSTVGERTSAARSTDADVLNRVGYDVDPRVIRQLLQNPRLTEQMVVVITARRPNRPAVLTEIYHSMKWRSRAEVRVALVRNPYTPPQIAMALLPTLKKQELAAVLGDGKVHREVRLAAETALQKKKEGLKKKAAAPAAPAEPANAAPAPAANVIFLDRKKKSPLD
jgi:hypothetical protein